MNAEQCSGQTLSGTMAAAANCLGKIKFAGTHEPLAQPPRRRQDVLGRTAQQARAQLAAAAEAPKERALAIQALDLETILEGLALGDALVLYTPRLAANTVRVFINTCFRSLFTMRVHK